MTDDDITLWYYTKIANRQLESLSRGYDPGDEKLQSDELQRKYQGKVLEEKAKTFSGLTIKEQQDILYTSMSGEETKTSKSLKDTTSHTFIIVTVQSYFTKLREIGVLNEWIKRSVPFNVFLRLPLDEKEKYHNAMVAFHDECLKKKNTEDDGQLSNDPVMASSPEPSGQTGSCPDFSDTSKWEKV